MRITFCVGVLLLGLFGCGPVFQLQAPEAFARFDSGDHNRWITADGGRMRIREIPNEPRATLPFWTEALSGHLKRRGYVRKSERCFKTARDLDACTLDHLLARGSGDWVMSVTLFVVEDRLVLIEVVGPWQRWKRHEPALSAAIAQFSPRR